LPNNPNLKETGEEKGFEMAEGFGGGFQREKKNQRPVEDPHEPATFGLILGKGGV